MGLLQEFGIKIPKFKVATSPAQVKEATASGGIHLFKFFIKLSLSLFSKNWSLFLA